MTPLLFLFAAATAPPPCDDAGGDRAASACWYERGIAADSELDTIWPAVAKAAREADARFHPTPRLGKARTYRDLIASQRAWRRYRDRQCSLESDWAGGGSLRQVIYGRCYVLMTAARIEQLQAIASGLRE